jgi:plasmid stabilization system protein ParE
MTHRLLITDPAEQDISAAYRWWRDHRSTVQAKRWYLSIREAIAALPTTATRHPVAPESELHPAGLRQVHFGLGRRPTHRVVFAIDGDTVSVVRVRHMSQDALTRDDLA